jgi:hypothetical protein
VPAEVVKVIPVAESTDAIEAADPSAKNTQSIEVL